MRFLLSHKWTLLYVRYHKSPKGWLKDIILGRLLITLVGLKCTFCPYVRYNMSQPKDDKMSLKGAWSLSRELFNFWKVSDNISKMVQDSLIVSIKFE